MRSFSILAALSVSTLFASTTPAQTVRFQTNVGQFQDGGTDSFDVVLNPTGNPDLQPLVDNFLANVGLGNYNGALINRAQPEFVVQIGTFFGTPRSPTSFANNIIGTNSAPAVIVDENEDGVVDFDTTGLSNTVGTISLALAAGDVNSGALSFFVNTNDNSAGLDANGFVPFATVSQPGLEFLSSLSDNNVSVAAAVGLAPNSMEAIPFDNVPFIEPMDATDTTDDDRTIIIERAFVVDAPDGFRLFDPIARALGYDFPSLSAPATAASTAASSSVGVAGVGAVSMPEPGGAVMVLLASGLLATRRRR